MVYIIITLIFTALIVVFMYYAYKFRNPYKLTMVFGKKGAGKTTYLTRLTHRYLKKGRPVYSTEHIVGAIQFDVELIGNVTFPENAVILIDEVGLVWDNRNFKTFRPEVNRYFKYQRHEKHTVYLFSQTFDVDVKIRNMTDAMYLIVCKFNFISIARKIRRSIMLVQPTAESESRIADLLEFEPILLSLFGAKTLEITFIPRWVGLFDSHNKLGLPLIETGEPCPIPEHLKKRFKFLEKNKEKYYDVFEEDYVVECDLQSEEVLELSEDVAVEIDVSLLEKLIEDNV